MGRSTRDVFDDHLRRAAERDVEGDIEHNFAPDVVLLTGVGILRGHDGVRRSREILHADIASGRYEYVTRLVDGDAAFLEWRAESDEVEINDGADSFVITDGRIRIQTIHYTIRHRSGYHAAIREHDETANREQSG
jgi:SnoaL-like domain